MTTMNFRFSDRIVGIAATRTPGPGELPLLFRQLLLTRPEEFGVGLTEEEFLVMLAFASFLPDDFSREVTVDSKDMIKRANLIVLGAQMQAGIPINKDVEARAFGRPLPN